jgi:hypothetical protein
MKAVAQDEYGPVEDLRLQEMWVSSTHGTAELTTPEWVLVFPVG